MGEQKLQIANNCPILFCMKECVMHVYILMRDLLF